MYTVDLFKNTHFNSVDIPCSPQLLYDMANDSDCEAEKIRVEDVNIVQDEWEANVVLSDIAPEDARQIDYVIIWKDDVEDWSATTCYTVKNYQDLGGNTIKLNLLLDPYNTMGGFEEGSGNIVIHGSANRMSVPLEHDDAVYPKAEDNTFFTLDEPFRPSNRIKMEYSSASPTPPVPEIPSYLLALPVAHATGYYAPRYAKHIIYRRNKSENIVKLSSNQREITTNWIKDGNLTESDYQRIITDGQYESWMGGNTGSLHSYATINANPGVQGVAPNNPTFGKIEKILDINDEDIYADAYTVWLEGVKLPTVEDDVVLNIDAVLDGLDMMYNKFLTNDTFYLQEYKDGVRGVPTLMDNATDIAKMKTDVLSAIAKIKLLMMQAASQNPLRNHGYELQCWIITNFDENKHYKNIYLRYNFYNTTSGTRQLVEKKIETIGA